VAAMITAAAITRVVMPAFLQAPATINLGMVSVFMKGSMDHLEGIKAEQAMMDSVLGAGVLQARLWEFPTGNCIF
jgi:hypothetical protein